MSLFRHLSVWSLRALALWIAIELGAGFYGEGAGHLGAWRRIAGHQTAMERLAARAASAEQAGRASAARLASAQSAAWALPRAADAALTLREALLTAGAEAPMIDSAERALGPALVEVHLTARWREPPQSSPAALHAVAARIPQLRVERLALEHRDGGPVVAEAEFVALVHVEGPRDP